MWLGAASYWMPKHYPASAWLEHAPFAFWITDVVRPRTMVELGTHRGFSFFVFAEACARLGLDTTLWALDNWEGDDQAGFYGQDVFDSVASVVAAEYSSRAHLLRGYFSESVSEFGDGTIDLLHIDGRHGYEDVKEDFETYRPKLSDRAVVLFHDTNEFQEGFGVHRFWAELATLHPSFMFEHGHGLGVLAVGPDVPDGLLDFFAAAREAPERVRRTYAELGLGITRQYAYEIEHVQALEDFQAEIVGLKQHIVNVEADRDRIRSDRDALSAKQDALQADYDRLADDLEGARRETADIRRQIDAVRASTSWRVTAPLRSIVSRFRPPSKRNPASRIRP
jgi:outer membrane murein-binding lipoprotein Lpp